MKELQRIHADVVTVILDQPFLFHADPAVVLERVAALEKVGFGNDVGEIVTKQPSLLALPVSVHTGPAPARARRHCTVWLPLGRNPPVRHRIPPFGIVSRRTVRLLWCRSLLTRCLPTLMDRCACCHLNRPVDGELFSRPATRYDVEVGPNSSK